MTARTTERARRRQRRDELAASHLNFKSALAELRGFPYVRCARLAGLRRADLAIYVALAVAAAAADAAMLALLIPVGRAAGGGSLLSMLPGKLDGIIGEHGATLSGGQRQRVAIARALLRKASVLVLDEATSGLDAITESLVRQAVANAVRHSTALVIAHRFATIQRADHVVVLSEGQVVEQGSVPDLLERRGLFHRIWEHQQFS